MIFFIGDLKLVSAKCESLRKIHTLTNRIEAKNSMNSTEFRNIDVFRNSSSTNSEFAQAVAYRLKVNSNNENGESSLTKFSEGISLTSWNKMPKKQLSNTRCQQSSTDAESNANLHFPLHFAYLTFHTEPYFEETPLTSARQTLCKVRR